MLYIIKQGIKIKRSYQLFKLQFKGVSVSDDFITCNFEKNNILKSRFKLEIQASKPQIDSGGLSNPQDALES